MLQRVLQLPVVSGTCECFQKTYNSTKEAHPLVASVCNAYEKGVQGASNLAAWSMEPVVRRLSTQCESSENSVASCPSTDTPRMSACLLVSLSDHLTTHLSTSLTPSLAYLYPTSWSSPLQTYVYICLSCSPA